MHQWEIFHCRSVIEEEEEEEEEEKVMTIQWEQNTGDR
jgi:hypothetical protein